MQAPDATPPPSAIAMLGRRLQMREQDQDRPLGPAAGGEHRQRDRGEGNRAEWATATTTTLKAVRPHHLMV